MYNTVDVYEEIKKRHRKNKDLQEERIREVEKRSPEYSELIDKKNAYLSEAAILRLTQGEREAERLEREAEKLERREHEILSELGLPGDYLDDIYDCPICQDKGYLDNNEPCNCIKKLIRQNKYRSFDLTENFKESTFESFNLRLFSKERNSEYGISPYESIVSYVKLAYMFIEKFPKEHPSFFIFGNVGVGKTFYVSCIVNELIKKDVEIIYISAPNLLNYLYEDVAKHLNLDESYKNEFKNVELLVIDDLGSENLNNFGLAALSEIIDYRILNNKSTIITSNYSPNLMLDIYPDRMIDRIMAFYEQMPFIGKNLRLKDLEGE